VAFVDVTVIEPVVVARGVHSLAASLALTATGVNLDCHALTDIVLIDSGAERHDRAHVLMAGSEILIEWHAALDHGRRAMIDDLKVRRADCDRVDAYQHFCFLWHRDRLFRNGELTGITQHPSTLAIGNGKFVVIGFYTGRCVHDSSKKLCQIGRSINWRRLVVASLARRIQQRAHA
jgi:hypothetical protein